MAAPIPGLEKAILDEYFHDFARSSKAKVGGSGWCLIDKIRGLEMPYILSLH